MDPTLAKKVAAKAVEFFNELHTGNGISDVEVEEIEPSDDGTEWHVTVGYARPARTYTPEARLRKMLNPALDFVGAGKERDYKRITVRTSDFEVIRMSLREPVA